MPFNISLDTQLLINFLIGDSYDEESILDLEEKIQTSNNPNQKANDKANQNRLLRNYIVVKFMRHLISEGKLNINITPTTMAEIVYSNAFHKALIDNNNLNDLVLKCVPAKDRNAIIIAYFEKYHIRDSYKSDIINDVMNFSTFTLKPEKTNSLLHQNNTLIHEIQSEIIKLLKLNICQNSLDEHPERFNFIHFPVTGDPLDNSLLNHIYQLSEIYRIDKKHVTTDGEHMVVANRGVPIHEINDTTIMATCSLLGLPLVSEDTKGLTSFNDIFAEANKKYNDSHKGTLPLGEPLSLIDFATNFYKDEFLKFAESFQIPKEISSIDHKKLIQQCIKEIKQGIPSAKFLANNKKSLSEQEICAASIAKYNARFKTLSQNDELELLSCEKFFAIESTATKNDIINFIQSSRKTFDDVLLHILQTRMKKFDEKIDELERICWGLKKKTDKELTKSSKNQNIPHTALHAKECLYSLLTTANHLLKKLYKQSPTDISYTLFNGISNLGFEILYNKKGVYGLGYKGLLFTLPQNLTDPELEQAKLSMKYNISKMDDSTILLMASNPYTSCRSGIANAFKEYITRFKQKYSEYVLEEPCPANKIKEILEKEPPQTTQYKKISMQTDAFIDHISKDSTM